MKKSLGIFVGACLAMGFAASVHAAANGMRPGWVITTYGGGGGTGSDPNPVFFGNCTAQLQLWPAVIESTSKPINWTTVSGSSPGACSAGVASLVNDPNTNWQVTPGLPFCACASPSMGRVIDLGVDNVSWTHEQELALDAELAELREEFRVEEYHEQIRKLVERRILPKSEPSTTPAR